MLLDLIGARNPGFHNGVGLGANQLFLHLPAIGMYVLRIFSDAHKLPSSLNIF